MKQTIIDIFLFAFTCFFIELFIDYELHEEATYLLKFLENSSVYLVPIIVASFFIMGFYKVSIKEHLKNILFLLLFCFIAFTMQDFPPFIFDEVNTYYVLLTVYTYAALAFLTSLLAYLFRTKNVNCSAVFIKNDNKM